MPSPQYAHLDVDQELGASSDRGPLLELEEASAGPIATDADQPNPVQEQAAWSSLTPRRLARMSAVAALAMLGAAFLATAPAGKGGVWQSASADAEHPMLSEESGPLQANASEATQLSLFGPSRPGFGYGRPSYGYGQPHGYGRPSPQAVASSRASCCAGVPGGTCCVDYPPVCCGMQQRCNLGRCVAAAYGRPMAGGMGMPGTGYGQPMGGMAQPGMGYQRPGLLSGLMGAFHR